MLLVTLVASLLRNLLTGRGIYRAGKSKGIVRAGYDRPLLSALQDNNINNKMDF